MVKIETHPEDQIVQDDHSNEASNLTKIKRKSDLNQSPSKKIKLENYSEQMEGMTAEQKKFVQGLLEENLKLSNEIGSVKEELFKTKEKFSKLVGHVRDFKENPVIQKFLKEKVENSDN